MDVKEKLSKWISTYYAENAEKFIELEDKIPEIPQEIKDYFFAMGKCSAIEDLIIELENLADEKEEKVTH